jgi:hypothetical protein
VGRPEKLFVDRKMHGKNGGGKIKNYEKKDAQDRKISL